jgi:hypothetical protein
MLVTDTWEKAEWGLKVVSMTTSNIRRAAS